MGNRCPSLWWKLVFLHLAVLSCSLSYGLFSPDFHFGDGVTEPPSDDTVHELKEGERLQMSCTLTNSALQKTCNASHMAIRLYRNKHYYTLGSQRPRGEFTLAMVIDKASVNESGPYYCYCHDTSLTAVKVTYSIQD